MNKPNRIYELLLDYAASTARVDELTVGLVWTACKAQPDGGKTLGLAMSPGLPTRTLSWPGTLAGRTLGELAGWITDWEPYKATVGMAAINCSLNARELPAGLSIQPAPGLGNLAVFEHFLPQLQGKKVVVIGRYPGIERYAGQIDLRIIERQTAPGDYPDPACEFLLPEADWVFLTASSLINKTFPRLAELSRNAVTVLMGPTVPWLPEFHEFGIDYLAGIEVTDADSLYRTAAEGGGVRIFENGARYRIVALSPDNSMAWLKTQIARCYAEKQQLTQAMEAWYGAGRPGRYPEFEKLDQITARLSRMDSSYKNLWDAHH
ncbi:Rossmann-like domain-containing protein [Methylobacter sp.]|uniref:Rossmann-like domain-containing protein n=1 Tax=Methylobacter sp. TaxID=2051955 RepID=UPI003DA3747C